jgi:hypothetical protein
VIARLLGASNVPKSTTLDDASDVAAFDVVRLDFSIRQNANAGKDCLGAGGHGMHEEPSLLNACLGWLTSIREAIAASAAHAGPSGGIRMEGTAARASSEGVEGVQGRGELQARHSIIAEIQPV